MIGERSMERCACGAEGCRRTSSLLDRRGTKAVVCSGFRRLDAGLYINASISLLDLLQPCSVGGGEIGIISDDRAVNEHMHAKEDNDLIFERKHWSWAIPEHPIIHTVLMRL